MAPWLAGLGLMVFDLIIVYIMNGELITNYKFKILFTPNLLLKLIKARSIF